MDNSLGRLKVRSIDIDAGNSIVLLHEIDCEHLGIHVGDRVSLSRSKSCDLGEVGIVDITDTMVSAGEVGVFNELACEMKLSPKSQVYVCPRPKPESIGFIRKKIFGEELSEYEITTIVSDIVDDKLSDIELSAFVTAAAIHGYTWKETCKLTVAMVETGDKLEFEGKVIDKHCIGGIPGNRTTMMVVPICTSLGLKMPKTSSRAITSPAGTADTMEVLCPVSYGASDIKKFVNKTGGCIVWGGAVNLAPADDKIIHVEYPLSIDAEGQVLASIISKKKSVGSNYVLIDLPHGPGAKISTKKAAEELGKKFINLGEHVNMKVHCIYTKGAQPIGNGIGPALEARDVLWALAGQGPMDLTEKSIMMTGEIMAFSDGAKSVKDGEKDAREALESGAAEKKMREIIKIQGGNPMIKPSDIAIGRFKKDILATESGKITALSNSLVANLAKTAGCPKDPRAGMYLHKKAGEKAEIGEPLYTLYAQSKSKLAYALAIAEGENPFTVA